jgi:hypothetical protein
METVGDGQLETVSVQEAVMLGAQSLEMFGKLMFPRTFRQDSPEFHRIIGRDLYSPSRYNAFEVFRDGAKTSLLRVYTAQRISYAISRTIMYVSVSQQHAMMSVRWLRRQIMYNRKFTQTYGLRKGEKWTDEHAEIFHDVEDTPITLLAMGITGQIRGFNPDDYRPDLIIIDDVLNEENCATEEQRKKLEALIFGALLNSLAPETDCPSAKAVFLQTPLNRADAIETCLKDPQWHGRRFGILDYSDPNAPDGKSRWEARWPTAVVQREKQAAIARGQYHIWMREKECQLVAAQGKTFEVEKLKFWDELPPGMLKIISIDPASSDSARADDCVVMAIGMRGPDVYVAAYEAEQAMMPDVVSMHFFNYMLEFSPLRAAVETISYQRVLAWYLEEEMKKRRLFLPISKIQDRRRKADRIVQTLSGLLNFGHLYIHPSMTKLITQMDEYDPLDDSLHDDILDALAIGITELTPHLRSAVTVDGEFELVDDESEYERIAFGGCP